MRRGMIRPGRKARPPVGSRSDQDTPLEGMRTEAQLRYALHQLSEFLGSQRRLARRLGFKSAYLNDILRGRRPISAKLAARLGYDRVVLFLPHREETEDDEACSG